MVNTITSFLKDTNVEKGSESKKHISVEGIYVFVSFDIVGSTQYKTISNDWYQITKKFYEDSLTELNKSEFVHWKSIGDEVVFYKRLVQEDLENIHELPKKVFTIMNTVRDSFFKEYPHSKMLLSLKGTMWIDNIKSLGEERDEHFQSYIIEQKQNLYESDSEGNYKIIDFLGAGIDLGFRLRSETQRNQLVVSAELVYLIIKVEQEEHLAKGLSIDKSEYKISETKTLKGIWYSRPYPVIFYRDNWENSVFEYDEVIKEFKTDKIEEFVPRVFAELGRDKVLDEFLSIIKESQTIKKIPTSPLAFHVVLMHFSNDLKKILFYKRGDSKNNSDKYDFGCVHLKSNQELEVGLNNYYEKVLGTADYNILKDNSNHPVPLSIFTYTNSSGNLINGLIFCAKLTKDIEVADLSVSGYSKIEWRDVDEVIGKTDQDNKLFEGSVSNIRKARELLQEFHN